MLADGGHVGLAKHRGAWGALGAPPLRFWGPLLTWGVLGTVFFLCFVQYKNLTGTARATCTPWLRGLRQHEQARAALARASAGCDDAGRAGAVPTRGKPGLRVQYGVATSDMHMYRVAPRAACKRGLLVRVHGRLRLRHGLHVLHGCGGCADMSKLGLRWQGRGLCPRGGQARAATSTKYVCTSFCGYGTGDMYSMPARATPT